MNLPRYELKSDNTFTVFEFKSEGAKGTIMVEIKNDFMIFGMRDSDWEIFEKE
jgi:hypothetical protein